MRKTLIYLTLVLSAAAAPSSASAQLWFESDYLFWGRNNDSHRQFLNGPGGYNSDDLKFGVGNGYRLILGGGLGNWELEGSYSKIDNWSDSDGGFLLNPLALDSTAFNPIVFPGGPATRFGFENSLRNAANQAAELSESEFLLAGSAFAASYSSALQDIQLNLAQHRDVHWFRWGVGYRNLRITETAGLLTAGTFNALDLNDGAGIGDPGNGPNDGLAHDSLIAAGFTHVAGGASGYGGIDPGPPASSTTVATLFGGDTENRLSGAQVFVAVNGAPAEFFQLEGFLRLGLFYNSINASTIELVGGSGADDGVYQRVFNEKSSKVSFGFNPGLRALVHLTDYVSLTAGYEILLLTGIALAPDQIGNIQTNLLGTQTYSTDASGVFFAHGGNVGLEIRW